MICSSLLGGCLLHDKTTARRNILWGGDISNYSYRLGISHPETSRGPLGFLKGAYRRKRDQCSNSTKEIFEETGLRVRLDSSWHMTTRYRPAPDIMKTVIYFLAQAEASTEICCQITEIIEARWCDYSSAIQLLTYENDRHILTKAHSILKQHEQNRI